MRSKTEAGALWNTENVKEAAAWTAYTDQGTMNFEGVSLDACIDRKIEVYERDGSIITLAAYSLKSLHIRMSGSFRENRVG